MSLTKFITTYKNLLKVQYCCIITSVRKTTTECLPHFNGSGVAGEESTDGSTMNPTVRGHRGSVNRQVVKDVLANIGSSYSVSMRNSFVSFKGNIDLFSRFIVTYTVF